MASIEVQTEQDIREILLSDLSRDLLKVADRIQAEMPHVPLMPFAPKPWRASKPLNMLSILWHEI